MDGADTTRDAVAAAFKEVAAREPAPAPEPAAEPAPEPASAAPEPEAAEPSKEERVRDGKGRFIVPPKAKPAAPEKAPASTGAPGQGGAVSVPPPAVGAAPPAVPALEALKPPQDWRAQAREKWGQVPREAQEEALRLHVETKKTLQEMAELRKGVDVYRQVTSPYEGMIRAEGLEPAQAVGLLLQREAALRTAPLAVKAKILAHGFNTFLGTSQEAIEAFTTAVDQLRNGQPQQGGPQPQIQIDPNQIAAQAERRVWERVQQHQQQSMKNEAETSLSQFEASHEFMGEHDYAPRLKRIMSVLMSDAAEEGQAMTYEDAYKEALTMHPETKKIIGQREAAKAATAKAATTQAARAASSSIKTEPAGPANGKASKDVRAAVSEAYYAQKNAH